ncbi:MAG TPA: metalloregulator ArsR/SmtB family transcription factor, partial [Verrucomicrobiales bacterium]|nr:metalloregulator ArsR/SmtB family transcription factor [Verrucomicrobiales bacterium]
GGGSGWFHLSGWHHADSAAVARVPSILESLRLLSEPTRLRLLLLLDRAELTVAELQEILSMKQSRISTHLALLKNAALVQVRRAGKNSLYSFDPRGAGLRDVLREGAEELPEARRDRQALDLALRHRADTARAYFDQLAGKFGRSYCPGRSWKGLAEALLLLLPRQIIADLGAGEGTISQLLARRAEKVIAVDSSEKMVAYGTRVAMDNGFTNLEYRHGDIECPPVEDASVDLAFFSQALHHAQQPARAVSEAFRIIRHGGRIVILDLLKHTFEQARELYADVWLGFAEVEIFGFLEDAGFRDIHITIVDRESEPPHFQTLMAIAVKP